MNPTDKGDSVMLPDGLSESFLNNARYYSQVITRADGESVSCDEGKHADCSGLVYGTDWSSFPHPTAGYCTCMCHGERSTG